MVDANGDITAPLFDVGPPEVALDLNRFLDRGSVAAGPPPENPFEFLGATPLVLPPMGPVDPFRNHTPHIAGLYEWCKTVLCLPIAAARLVLLGIAIAVGYVTTVVALYGWKDKERPMSRWRSRVMCVTRLCARFILFSFGRRYSQILKFIHGSSQFLSGSAQIKKQPTFMTACETAFAKFSDNLTGHISVGKAVVHGAIGETLCQLFDAASDGIVRRDDFMNCLQENPLFIALFAANVKFDDQMDTL